MTVVAYSHLPVYVIYKSGWKEFINYQKIKKSINKAMTLQESKMQQHF